MKYEIDPQILAACSKTASSDASRLALQNVFVEFSPAKTVYVATDGRCLSCVEKKRGTDLPPGESGGRRFSLLFPVETCKEIARMAKKSKLGSVEIEPAEEGRGVTVFFPGGSSFGFVQPCCNYPDWRRVLPSLAQRSTEGRDWPALSLGAGVLCSVAEFFSLLPGADRYAANYATIPVGAHLFAFVPTKNIREESEKGSFSAFAVAMPVSSVFSPTPEARECLFAAIDSAISTE